MLAVWIELINLIHCRNVANKAVSIVPSSDFFFNLQIHYLNGMPCNTLNDILPVCKSLILVFPKMTCYLGTISSVIKLKQ